MVKTPQEILAEWADPETGGTMPREVREAALSVLRLVAEWNQPTPESEWQKMCNRALRAEARVKELEDALQAVDEALEQNPSGVDDEADPDDPSPEDASAHLCGLIRHDIRAALRGKS